MINENKTVFISYCHADDLLVTPVVKLLRASTSFVFQDIDNIQPGKNWRNEICNAITETQLTIVFWCEHSRDSQEVSAEWKIAIENQIDILPLLLDSTPLPNELTDYQNIDFRDLADHSSTSHSDFSWKNQLLTKYKVSAAVACLAVGIFIFSTYDTQRFFESGQTGENQLVSDDVSDEVDADFVLRSSNRDDVALAFPGLDVGSSANQSNSDSPIGSELQSSNLFTIISLVVLGFFSGLLALFFRKKYRQENAEQRMAEALELELLKRTAI